MTPTDPQAGSDLGVLRTKALLPADSGPRGRGDDIFISGGMTTRSSTTGEDAELPGLRAWPACLVLPGLMSHLSQPSRRPCQHLLMAEGRTKQAGDCLPDLNLRARRTATGRQ